MVGQLLELSAREGHDQVLRNAVYRHDVRQVDFRRGRARQLDFGFFGRFLEPLQGHRVLAQVDVVLLLELVGHPVDDHVVEVVASEVGVAVGRFDLEHAVAQFQNRDIERTAAQVVHGDLHVLISLVQTVGERGRRRLVDDPADFQARDLTGFLGRLTLRVREVGRYGDNCLAHFGAQIIFGRFLHFLKDDGRNFLRRVEAPVDVDAGGIVVASYYRIGCSLDVLAHFVVGLAHEALDRRDRPLGVGDGLTLGRVAYLALVVVYESDDRGRRAPSFAVGYYHRLAAFHDGDAGVRGTEVNSNNLSHNRYLFISVITQFIVLILFCSRILQSLCQAVRQGDFASMLSARALPFGQVGILR